MERRHEPKVKRTSGRKMWVWLLTVLLISSLSMFGCSKSTPQPASQQAAQTPTTQQQEAKKPAIDWATATINADNVKLAMTLDTAGKPATIDANFPKDITAVEVEDVKEKAGQKKITIRFTPSIPATSGNDFLKAAGGTAIMGSSILFTNPKVEEVFFAAEVPDKDNAGKFSSGVDLTIDREFATNKDWKAIAAQHATDPGYIFREASSWFIFDDIMKTVDEKVVKTGN